jgi:hypothetical protein
LFVSRFDAMFPGGVAANASASGFENPVLYAPAANAKS